MNDQALLCAALEITPVAAILIRDEKILYSNPAYHRLSGYSAAELYGMSIYDLIPTSDHSAVAEISQRLEHNSLHIDKFEICGMRKDGSQYPAHVQVGRILLPDGPAALAFVTDLSGLRQAEQRLRENEQKLRHIIGHSDELFYIHDTHNVFIYLSPQCETIIGYSPEELKFQWTNLLTDHPMNARGIEMTRKALETGERQGIYYLELYRKDGSRIFVEIDESPLKDENGNVIGMTGAARDVTARLRAETEQQQYMLRIHTQRNALKRMLGDEAIIEGKLEEAALLITKLAAETLEVARSSLWLLGDNGTILRCLVLYEFPSGRQSQGAILHSGDFPAYFNALNSDKTISAVDAEHDERTCELRQSYLQPLGITSMLDAPIWAGGRLLGVVCNEHIGSLREWHDDEAIFAGYLADQFAQVLINAERLQTVKAQQESERKYRRLFENAMEGIYQASLEGRYISLNPAFAHIYGYDTPEEMIRSVTDIARQLYVNPEDRKAFIAELEKQGFVRNREMLNQRKDGKQIWVSVNAQAIRDEQGRSLYYEGIISNITERKQAEETLRQSEQRYRTLVDNIPGAVYRCGVSPPWRMVYMSDEIYEISGYPASDFVNGVWQDYEKLIVEEYRAHVTRAVTEGIKKRKPYILEYPIYHANGSIRWVFEKGRALYDEAGKPLWLDGVIVDHSEQKRLQEAILRANKEWEATFDAVLDMIILTDEQNRIIRCNRATSSAFAPKYEVLLGVPVGTLFYGDSAASRHLEEETGTTQFPTLEGWYEVSAYPVNISAEQQGKVYIIKDVTTQRQLENALLASQKYVDLGTLAASIAHEINSPLQVITGASEVLLQRIERNEIDKAKIRQRIEMINKNGWRVAEIVRSLLTYARSTAGDFTTQDLNLIIGDALLLIEHQLETWANIRVITHLKQGLPPLMCDRNRITQVIINILTNARDAMPNGGKITIRTDYNSSKDLLLLQIADTGHGIPTEIREKIFEPFFTTKPAGLGTGLGLSIIKSIVGAHGGDVELESSAADGTVFTVLLPRIPPDFLPKTD